MSDEMEIADEIAQDNLCEEYEQLIEDYSNLRKFLDLLSNPRLDEVAIKIKEQCIYSIARIYSNGKQFSELMSLIKQNEEFFSAIPKAKTAKIIRNIISFVATSPDSLDIQISLCMDVVEWCKHEKRTFLRQRIEAKLATLFLQRKESNKALATISDLLKELKRLDDKQMLTEAHLTEARIYHSLQNIPKSKASLTASRTAANSIYVVPLLQAEIDEMSGILHCEEADYTTAYSYFLEAFDAYDQAGSSTNAVTCLQYMILCKVLNDSSHEVPNLLSSKIAVKHSGKPLEAMSEIAKAARVRSLEEFKRVIEIFGDILRSDYLISHHLDLLYDRMVETNLLKIIHPYSCVEISHIAKLIKQSEESVVRKLSQMILDHKFYGILDQGKGHLIIYQSTSEDFSFSKSTEIINNLGQVVDALFSRSKAINKVN